MPQIGPFKPPACCTCCGGLTFCTLNQLAAQLHETSQFALVEDVLVPAGLIELVNEGGSVRLRATRDAVLEGIAKSFYSKTYWNKDVIFALAEEYL